jgi:hypothetical protein
VKSAIAQLDWDSIDDPNDEKQVERALRDLKKDHTYLFKVEDVDGGAGRGSGRGGNDDEPTPGAGRLRRAYETANKK